MIVRHVGDLKFGELKRKFGRGTSYVWNVEGQELYYSTTRQVSSQRKLRDKMLELTGEAILPMTKTQWTMLVTEAFSKINTPNVLQLEDMWIRAVAEYCLLEATDEQEHMATGRVYETANGFMFTTKGLADYIEQFDEFQCLDRDWHISKLLKLMGAKSSSVTLKNFKGRTVKINKFSCRVDDRFTKYYEETIEHAEEAI